MYSYWVSDRLIGH